VAVAAHVRSLLAHDESGVVEDDHRGILVKSDVARVDELVGLVGLVEDDGGLDRDGYVLRREGEH
jgi:hypothetical protein